MASFILRPATLEDAEFLFRLRTDPTVIEASNGKAPFDLAAHLHWFAKTLDHPARMLFIVESEGIPIGQCQLDGDSHSAEVSIALTRESRGHGIGTEVLRELARRAEAEGIRWLEAVIKESNAASRKAFLKAGYSVEEITDGIVHMGVKCGS